MKLNIISNHIRNFINLYPNQNIINISPLCKNIIEHFLNEIKNAETNWKNVKNSISNTFNDIQTMEYSNSELFNLIPEKIQNHISTTFFYLKTFIFFINKRKIIVTIGSSKKDNNYLLDCLKLIYIWLYISTKYSDANCSQEINIYLYLTNHVKEKEDNITLSAIHANTAYTHVCSQKTEIFIFREEEWFKVFIHETFHNLGFDFSSLNIKIAQKKLLKHFIIESKFELYETYNETWATFINLIFVSYFSKKINNFENLLNSEIIFSLYQCYKIFQHYNLSYDDLFQNKKQHFIEDTNIFCYYVLKSIMIFYINDFLKWCNDYNGENIIMFNKTQQNIIDFTNFIIKLSEKYEFIKELNNIERYVKNNKPNIIVRKTMRMTVFG